jgi:hypothetical protein
MPRRETSPVSRVREIREHGLKGTLINLVILDEGK